MSENMSDNDFNEEKLVIDDAKLQEFKDSYIKNWVKKDEQWRLDGAKKERNRLVELCKGDEEKAKQVFSAKFEWCDEVEKLAFDRINEESDLCEELAEEVADMLQNAWNEPQKTRENWDEEKFGPNVELEGDPKWDFGNLMYHRSRYQKEQKKLAELEKLKTASKAMDNSKQARAKTPVSRKKQDVKQVVSRRSSSSSNISFNPKKPVIGKSVEKELKRRNSKKSIGTVSTSFSF